MSFVKKHIKIISAVLLAAVLLLCIGIFSYCHARRAPELDAVRERFIYLIERSKQINEVFFGDGLPVYVRDSDLSKEKFIYIGEQNRGFERVMEVSPYLLTDEMKAEAQRVYSSEYCDRLFESCFDGIVIDGTTLIEYTEISDWLYQNMAREALAKNEKIYLYSTMKIVRPSNIEYVNVEISYYMINKPDEIKSERLSFSFEDGNWYLDTPTY